MNIFYRLLYFVYDRVYGRQQMLHFPLYKSDDQDLLQGQAYFTEFCLSYLGDISGKRLLDIGCGNGVQTIYICDTHRPAFVYGVDLNPMHIEIATKSVAHRKPTQIGFALDDAQRLRTVDDESFDLVLCTESAFHYPDKAAFLGEVNRVLRRGGRFVIADLLMRKGTHPRPFDARLSLFYWPLERYHAAFNALGLKLVSEEEMTDRLISGLCTSGPWLRRRASSRFLPYYLAELIGRLLIANYKYELRNKLDYFLLAGHKD
jgi:2-polyprenyl-3-methyl-5-hydroxy-6-metoxy-1,4-benzoquinol methylase